MHKWRRLGWAVLAVATIIFNQNCAKSFNSIETTDLNSEDESSSQGKFCLHPQDSTPQLPGTSYVSFTTDSGATQAACDSARITSVCDATTGTFLPAPTSNTSCLVAGQTCAYTNATGRAVPTGNSENSAVTGYARSSATYPTLCGAQVTRTCQASGQWTGAVPLYTSCQQNCAHPDTGDPVSPGTVYGVYYTRSAGTQTECDAARVAAGSSTCNGSTGIFTPALPTTRYKSCTVSMSSNNSMNCNLISDTKSHPVVSVAKPAYLSSFIEPTYGTKITRISGDPGTAITSGGTWGKVVHHHYSKDQAWNADQSLIYIDTNSDGGSGPVFLDGSTYKPVFSQNPPSNSDVRWHRIDPNLMVYAAGNVLGYWNPRTNARTVIQTFSGYSGLLLGPWEGNLSLNGDMVVLTGENSAGKSTAFAYDIVNKKKYPDINFAAHGTEVGWASISPKGKYVVVEYEEDDHTVVFDLNGNFITRTAAGEPSHFDMSVDANGDEVMVGSGRSSRYGGRVIKIRLSDGVITPMTVSGYGSHASSRSTNLTNWSTADFFDEGSYIYRGEIITFNLDGSKVYRLAHTRNPSPDYESETHASVSPDGKRVIFVSNWGSSTSRPAQVYMIDLRDKCAF